MEAVEEEAETWASRHEEIPRSIGEKECSTRRPEFGHHESNDNDRFCNASNSAMVPDRRVPSRRGHVGKPWPATFVSSVALMSETVEFVVNWLGSETLAARLIRLALLFGAGVLAAFIIRAVLTRLMRRLLTLVSHRYGGTAAEPGRSRYIALVLVPRILFWFIILFFAALAVQALAWLPLYETWSRQALLYLPRVLTAILLGMGGIWAGMILRDVIVRMASVGGIRYARAVAHTAQVTVVVAAFIIAFHQIGVDLSFLSLVVGIVLGAALLGMSLAFGLGAQFMASNIIGCHYVRQLYRVGTSVEIGGIAGTIVNITAAFVLIETEDGQVSIPGREFAQQTSRFVSPIQERP